MVQCMAMAMEWMDLEANKHIVCLFIHRSIKTLDGKKKDDDD